MTDVWYGRNGCFTKMNMVDNFRRNEFYREKMAACYLRKAGILRARLMMRLSLHSLRRLETMPKRNTSEVSNHNG